MMEKIGVIPEIENSYKYEEQIMMGPRDALNQYLSDKSLLSSCNIFKIQKKKTKLTILFCNVRLQLLGMEK